MFHLYTFQITQKRYFVCEKNWKAARNTISRLPENKNVRLTDIVGHRLNKNCSEIAGLINLENVLMMMPWWVCRCGTKEFLPINGGTSCRCRGCGRETRLFF